MEISVEARAAVDCLTALAQPSRLAVFRLLVEAGPDGMPAGAIAKRLGLPSATLSFHLAQLSQAQLVTSMKDGRSIIHGANYAAMNGLIGYLTRNCCRGQGKPPPRAEKAETPSESLP
jgi:DNA-binding transcriptional ArsR family regulator